MLGFSSSNLELKIMLNIAKSKIIYQILHLLIFFVEKNTNIKKNKKKIINFFLYKLDFFTHYLNF